VQYSIAAQFASQVPVSGCGARHLRRRQSAVLICRPQPIAQVAFSATGGAPLAPQTLTLTPSLAVDFESTTSTFFSHRQMLTKSVPK